MLRSKSFLLSIGLVLLSSACGALGQAQGGVNSATSTTSGARGMVDSTTSEAEALKGLGDKFKKKKGDGQDEDGDRLHAKESPINVPIDDQIDNKKDDRFDWRKVQLGGKSGIATFEVHWDDERANLDIDVFDKFGTNIGKSPPRLEGQTVKRVLVQVDEPGLFYFRISAPGSKDASIYTAIVKWKGPGGAPKNDTPPPPPPAPAAPGTPPGVPGAPPGAPPAPTPLAQDPTKLLGNIVTAYKEDTSWVLYIDKGSASRVRVGMSGTILEGADGDKLLDGATFSISQVIDANKSIARSSYNKALGKNKRVVLNLR